MALFNTIVVLLYLTKLTISHYKTIECIKNERCNITCNETHLCTNSQINCPINNQCDITCNPYSCHSTIINANHSSSFNMHIDSNFVYSNISIYLPSIAYIHIHKLPNTNTNILKHIFQKHTNHFQFILYALNGFNNINIIHTNNPQPIHSNINSIMYCNHNYNKHCIFSTHKWSCLNTNHICSKNSVPPNHNIRHLLQSETIIAATTTGTIYSDNLVASIAPPQPGWSFIPYSGRITWEPDLGNNGVNFLGPYSGSGNSVLDDIIYIEQQFACSKASSVSVNYWQFWCGDTEPDDYAQLNLNDIAQPNTQIYGDSTNWDATLPAGYVGIDSLEQVSGCNLGWQYKKFDFTTNGISYVNSNELFKVTFEMGLSANVEWAAIAAVSVQCVAFPTANPTVAPSKNPTVTPSKNPTINPSNPTYTPSNMPTGTPTYSPSNIPSKISSQNPTIFPSKNPTNMPSNSPTDLPSNNPTVSPVNMPSETPTFNPTNFPSKSPSELPTFLPTITPTNNPTLKPSKSPLPKDKTNNPTINPSKEPSRIPTYNPSDSPSNFPTIYPTNIPTNSPSKNPTISPTNYPTNIPSKTPTFNPSNSPTNIPSQSPTYYPTISPTNIPSETPTFNPSNSPTLRPTRSPLTANQTHNPTNNPTKEPSVTPTYMPSMSPNTPMPTITPTNNPTYTPTYMPSNRPTDVSMNPTISPTPIICNDDCSGDDDDEQIQIQVVYYFSDGITYNLKNMECFLYKIFEKYKTFSNYFSVCDINIVNIFGNTQETVFCKFGPCLYKNSNIVRRLLTNVDGNTTMTIISEDDEITNNLQLNQMENDFENEFQQQFGVNINVLITINDSSEDELLTNNNKTIWDILGGLSILWWIVLILGVFLCFIFCLLIFYMRYSRQMMKDLSDASKPKPKNTKDMPKIESVRSSSKTSKKDMHMWSPRSPSNQTNITFTAHSVPEGQSNHNRILSVNRDQLEMVTTNKMYNNTQSQHEKHEYKQTYMNENEASNDSNNNMDAPTSSDDSKENAYLMNQYIQNNNINNINNRDVHELRKSMEQTNNNWDNFHQNMMLQIQQQQSQYKSNEFIKQQQLQQQYGPISPMHPNPNMYQSVPPSASWKNMQNTFNYANNGSNPVSATFSNMPPSASWKNMPNTFNNAMNVWQQQQYYNNYQHFKKQSDGIKAIKPNIVNNLANRFERKDNNNENNNDVAPPANNNNNNDANSTSNDDSSTTTEEGSYDSTSESESESETEEQTMFIESKNDNTEYTQTDTMVIEDSKEDTYISKLSNNNNNNNNNDSDVLKGMRITPQIINTNISNSDIFGSMDGRIKFQNINCSDNTQPNTPISMIIHNNNNNNNNNNNENSKNDVKLDLIIDQDMIISDDDDDGDDEYNMENINNLGISNRKKHQPRQTTMEFQKNLSMNVIDNNILLDDVVNDMAQNDS